MNDPKPGWQTTEFWLTLVANVLAFATVLGLISTADAATLQGALSTAIPAALALVGSVITVWTYIRSRLAVKTQEAVVMSAIDPISRDKAKLAGIPWLTLLMWAIQYGPRLKELIDKLIAARKSTPTK